MSALLDAPSGAVTACADADLGDLRRPQRLVQLAHALAPRPGAALPDAWGSGAMLTAAYRFCTNEDMAPDDMVHSHLEATYSRLNTVPLVLAVQATTAANWTNLRVTEGLGPLGHPACHGLRVHPTVALTPERVPWGLLAQQGWARDPDDMGKRARRKQWPISQQESQQWLHRLDAVCTARDCCPTTRMVSVGDRDAAVYAVLAAPRPAGVELLLRAAWHRCVNAPQRSVGAAVAAQPVAAHLLLHVPRRGPHPAREAPLAVRDCPVPLGPPPPRKAAGWPAVTLWTEQGSAVEPPAEAEPIEGLLWTTVAVETVDDAIERVQWYACRWGMEVWPRIVKSGCHRAARQCQQAERFRRALALYSGLAWRIFYATMLARAVPDAPCSALLAPDDWQALSGAIHRVPTPPAEPPTRGQAVTWIAPLGGFVGRRRSDRPGAEVMGRGFQPLADLTTMDCILRPDPP
jgi:Transposase DNA-binding/Transposase Tn5 dimerisation domain